MSRPVSPTVASNLSGGVPRAVSSIPMELLRAIFGHVAEWSTTPWTERPPPLANTNLRRAPFHLASVCVVWRDAVLQTPELWSTIYLTDGAIRDPVAYVNACLDRSAQWPLQAIIDFSHTGALSNDEAMSIWGEMSSRSSQWQRCHFTFTGNPAMTWDKWPESAPCLEELVVVFQLSDRYDSPSPEAEDHLNRPLPVAPRLKRLAFDSIHSPPGSLENLEYLSIHLRKANCNILWDVLSQTPLLREARIFWPHSRSRSEGSLGQTILLPNLQFLEMYGHTSQEFNANAESLNLPALHTIAVSSYCTYPLAEFFRQVSSQVHTLVVRYERGSWLSEADARSICRLGCLKKIVINGAQMEYATGKDMAIGSYSQRFSGFFEALRDAPEMRQLNTLKLVNCKHHWDMSNVTSFELDFQGDSKGWADPQLALFMNSNDSD